MTKHLIAPSILAADFAQLGKEVRDVEAAGADWIHVDVMDGRFVPNISIGPAVTRAVAEHTRLPIDVHLMIVEPDKYVADFAKAGATTIGVHVEACPHLHRSIQNIKSFEKRACVVLNPATPASHIEPVLEDVDQVLVMSVNPGFGGQDFIDGAMRTVETLREWIDGRGLSVDLQVDGGIKPETIGRAASAGANCFVAGTAVFGEDDYKVAIDELRAKAREGTSR